MYVSVCAYMCAHMRGRVWCDGISQCRVSAHLVGYYSDETIRDSFARRRSGGSGWRGVFLFKKYSNILLLHVDDIFLLSILMSFKHLGFSSNDFIGFFVFF